MTSKKIKKKSIWCPQSTGYQCSRFYVQVLELEFKSGSKSYSSLLRVIMQLKINICKKLFKINQYIIILLLVILINKNRTK